MTDSLSETAGKAILWRAAQQGGVNLIYLLRLLILARLLAPEDFGLLAIAMTGVGVLLRITDFGMIPALVQNAGATDQHYHAAWTIGVFRAAIIGVVVFFAAPVIAMMFAEPRSVDIVRALSVLPLLEAAASIRIAEVIRNLRFRSLCVAKLSEALANTALSIALARSLGVWALVIGTLAGPAAYAVMSYRVAPHRPRLALDRHAARALVRYGRWIFLTGLIAVAAGALLRAVISRELGTAALGLYFLAAKLAFFPNEIASEVFGAVSFPMYARVRSNMRRAGNAFRAIFTATLMLMTPVFVLMFVLAPSLVNDVLGDQWQGTEPLIRLLAMVGFIGLIGDAVVPVLKGLGEPRKYALLEAGQSLFLIVFAWLFIDQFGLIGAGYAWLSAIAATLVGSIFLLRQTLQFPFVHLTKPFAAIALASVFGAFTAFYVQVNLNGLVGLSLAILSFTAVTAAALWLLDRAFDLQLTKEFVRTFPQTAPLFANAN
jgi:O-antigen/teichoic acid export membrane protein